MKPQEDSPSDQAGSQIDAEIERELAQALEGQDIDQLMEQASQPAEPQAPAGTNTDEKRQPGTSPPMQDMLRGRVAAIHGEDVLVDLHGPDSKNQGIVPLGQFERPPRIGSIMDFVVQKRDPAQGLVMLSREGAAVHAAWDQLHSGCIVDARVTGTNKGGLELELIGGIRAFMPASQVDLHYVEDLEVFMGQKLRAKVQQVDTRHKKVLLSRRGYLEAQRRTKQADLWEKIEVGQVLEGVVSGVADYGAFVDLGGADGLVHVSDISHSRVDKPGDVVSVGQAVTVKVIKLDREQQRIGLGMKQVAPDPWDGIADRFSVGEQVTGRVVRAVDFGAFVEIEEGVEGLVPVSELSWNRINHPGEVVREGQVLQLTVLSIDPDKHRVSLSLKQAMGDPWAGAAQKYEKGSLVEATVRGIADFGAFVEVEQGVEAMVHISELADHRVDRVEDVLQVGQSKQFRVLDVDEPHRRMRVSLRTPSAPRPAQQPPSHSGHKPARKKPGPPLKGGLE
jgi:small subunit ribosomal protein S1